MPLPPPGHVIACGTIVGMQVDGAHGGGLEEGGGEGMWGWRNVSPATGVRGGEPRCGYAIDLSPPVSRAPGCGWERPPWRDVSAPSASPPLSPGLLSSTAVAWVMGRGWGSEVTPASKNMWRY